MTNEPPSLQSHPPLLPCDLCDEDRPLLARVRVWESGDLDWLTVCANCDRDDPEGHWELFPLEPGQGSIPEAVRARLSRVAAEQHKQREAEERERLIRTEPLRRLVRMAEEREAESDAYDQSRDDTSSSRPRIGRQIIKALGYLLVAALLLFFAADIILFLIALVGGVLGGLVVFVVLTVIAAAAGSLLMLPLKPFLSDEMWDRIAGGVMIVVWLALALWIWSW